MKKLNDTELRNINGGSISLGLALGIGALVTFIFGFLDGYVRPLKCNK